MKKLILLLLCTVSGFFSYGQSIHGLSYSLALPTGKTGDYIGKLQWRGVTLEGKYFLTNNITLGWQTGWNTMYESETGEFTEGTVTRSGTQYRYLNVWPALFTMDYLFGEDGDIQPYAGVGAGAYWIGQRTLMGLTETKYSTWNFGIAPEIGVLFPVNLNSNFYVNLKYNYGINGSSDVDNYSFLTFNVGFLWY
jgi:hypothetical protein